MHEVAANGEDLIRAVRGTPFIARRAIAAILTLLIVTGCATIRVTDPYQTADQQFLMSTAAADAVSRLSTDLLRDRLVWVDTSYLNYNLPPSVYLTSPQPLPFEQSYLVAELRAKLLKSGVRLAASRDKAQVVIEARSGGLSLNRQEYLLGIPSVLLPGSSSSTGTAITLTTPELAILKSTKQHGFASIAFVAYLVDTGELVVSSGPFVGRTVREDSWFLGIGPRTVGNIPPAQK